MENRLLVCLNFPAMTTILADSVCDRFACYLCMFAKYCDNQLWKCKKQPCKKFPPPANEQPIKKSLFALFFYFINGLHLNIFALALGTSHCFHLNFNCCISIIAYLMEMSSINIIGDNDKSFWIIYNVLGGDIMIADRIKKLRQQFGLTQSDLAKKLNITRSSVNTWELGISIPSTQYIVELAELFKVSTDYILGLSRDSVISTASLTEEQTKILFTLVQYFNKENEKNG